MSKSIALFAAGCFWGVQDYFDSVAGVVETEVGYSGGRTVNPRYEEVCTGETGHTETVKIVFDEGMISYETLLRHFFRMHDATQRNRQGPDIGTQYRSAIFYLDEHQQRVALEVKEAIDVEATAPIATEVSPAKEFYPAEDYHQHYVAKTGKGGCRVPYQQVV